ncbi:MAG: HPr family phosphocarrier protein [endosymbiont of Galathealinum brachiosum]|uniref:HPr family phosphocarrier protein n=1 Tax=endosymbiont of Galathealinum brachiosum TaxID=2200906 RepID=A0A370DBN5_9GAMM|nr:MAG: HPr family phosphocarrier protein [endosymbiont of Galathealinum brachiosum]
MGQINQDIEIINKLGMHARAAAKFVSIASGFSSHVDVEKNGQRINGKSIMGVMMLAAGKGSFITLHIDGDDSEACVSALSNLINNRFDEDE